MQSMSEYFSAVQLRTDRWSALRQALEILAREPDCKGAKAKRKVVDAEEHEDEALPSLEARALNRPYFEVMVVDDLGEHQERWVKQSMTAMRRPEDPFVYEPVVVPSLHDALIGILFNYNIQAVVVRPGLRLESTIELPLLTRYLNRAGGSEDITEIAPEDYGPEL